MARYAGDLDEDIGIQEYAGITRGLELSDNVFALGINQSPDMHNVNISRKGISPTGGYAVKMILPEHFNVTSTHDFFVDGEYWIIAITHPNIIAINPESNSWHYVYREWRSDGGIPVADQNIDTLLLCDGVNDAIYIQKSGAKLVGTKLTWPQQLSVANNATGTPGNITDSIYNQASVQQPDDAGKITNVLYANGRFILSDAKYSGRQWYSTLTDNLDFNTNTASAFDIAFFIDLPTPFAITGMRRLNNKLVIIYLEYGFAIQQGTVPPGAGYTGDLMSWQVRNTSNGLLQPKLVQDNGEGDHWFFSDNGRAYSLQSSDNFDQANPKGFGESIFPLLSKFDNYMWNSSILLNDQLRGELRFFCPDSDEEGYITRCLKYKYTTGVEEQGWYVEDQWGEDFYCTNVHLNKVTKDTYVFNQGNRMLVANTGNTYDASEPVALQVELRPETFGHPTRFKELLGVIMIGKSLTGAQIQYGHKWENPEEEGLETVTMPKVITKETLQDYTDVENNIVSDVGDDFTYLFFPVQNRNGVVLKQRISTKKSQDLEINKIILLYRLGGHISSVKA